MKSQKCITKLNQRGNDSHFKIFLNAFNLKINRLLILKSNGVNTSFWSKQNQNKNIYNSANYTKTNNASRLDSKQRFKKLKIDGNKMMQNRKREC